MSKARDLADLAGNDRLDTVATSDGALSNRNLIINGAMQVAQRGTSVTGTTANGYSTVDRFTNYLGGSSDYATFDVSQSTDAPTGFSKSHKIEVATLGSTAGPVTTAHNIEGNSIGSLGWGSAGANKATISFWVKSNVTGVYALEAKAQNGASLYRNVNNYTVNSSGVWEYKTITIDALTAITPASDSSLGLALEFWLDDSDGAYNGSSSAFETWVDGSTTTNGARAYGQTAQILSAASNYWQITGVQLEVGDTATPFEHRRYSDELQSCMRYYQFMGGTAYAPLGVGKHYAAGQSTFGTVPFLSEMRSPPSVVIRGTIMATDRVSYDDNITALTGASISTSSLYAAFNTGTTRTDRTFHFIAPASGSTGGLEFDAEL